VPSFSTAWSCGDGVGGPAACFVDVGRGVPGSRGAPTAPDEGRTLGGVVMSELGVTVQNLAQAEIYQALETGNIDATDWVGPYDDAKLGFHQIAKNYYYPGWWEPGPALSFYVNRAKWDELPSQYREALQTAAYESAVAG